MNWIAPHYPLNSSKSRKLTNFKLTSTLLQFSYALRRLLRGHTELQSRERRHGHTARKFNMQSEDINSGRIRGRGLCFCIWHYRWNYWISNWLWQRIQLLRMFHSSSTQQRLPPKRHPARRRHFIEPSSTLFVASKRCVGGATDFRFVCAFVSFMSFGNWILLASCPCEWHQPTSRPATTQTLRFLSPRQAPALLLPGKPFYSDPECLLRRRPRPLEYRQVITRVST